MVAGAGIGVPLFVTAAALAAEHDMKGTAAMSDSSPSSDRSPMQTAIKHCLDCHSMCLRTAMTLCLDKGGRHVEAAHFRLMINCAELCQTSANFMLSGSPLHGSVCGVCAEVCEACARSCEQLGDMKECADECRRCAKSCKTMA